jgi:hypothetical protein
MIVKRLILLILICGAFYNIFSQQTTAYILTKFPLAAVGADSALEIEWTGISRPTYLAPDSGILYFDRFPGGGNINNYRYKVETFTNDTINKEILSGNNRLINEYPPKRLIKFRPKEQTGMGIGVFYYIVAFKTSIMGRDTVFTSNELQMIIESDKPVNTKSPIGTITDLTPTFTWDANPGVPYYHLILSDEALSIDTGAQGSTGLKISGLSIVWQAITPNTQIVYGDPDPSGTITASPPPLSPGQTYSWVVLNNYGNQMAFTSMKYGLPKTFTIQGKQLNKPQCLSPARDTMLFSFRDSIVTFKWTNLDSSANTYKIYVYMQYSGEGYQDVDARLVVWENEVTAKNFAGKNGILDSYDTGYVSINAKNILTNNYYSWKVFAIDNKGASTASDLVKFNYNAPAMGKLELFTREKIVTKSGSSIDTVIVPITIAEMKVEVISGSMEAPLFFYTDLNGNLYRERPKGVYRITAQKSGFESLVKTIILDSAATVNDTFYLKRPDATVYGKITNEAGEAINAASVIAVSERNDTVKTTSDALGSFVLNCYEGDWYISAAKSGYSSSIPQKVSVSYGQNLNIGTILLNTNPYTVSGVVKNANGEPILGVNVKALKEGNKIAEIPSTPQNGSFSFSLQPGSYVIVATKTGFTAYNKTINVSGSMQLTITLNSGATLITGYIYGRNWVSGKQVIAPITKATVMFVDTISCDTVSTLSDATYGDYRVSVTGGKIYKMILSAYGFLSKSRYLLDTVKSGTTISINDTLNGLGMLSGKVLLSKSNAAFSNATINILENNRNIIASAKSGANGYFEIRNLKDGIFTIKAGASGYVCDSIRKSDTIIVSSGKTTIGNNGEMGDVNIYMSPGSKIIYWVIDEGKDTTSLIKIKSPLSKSVYPKDTLKNAGAGDYIISVSSKYDSVIDLAYHTFTIADSQTSYCDSVFLPAYNLTKDTLNIEKDSIKITLGSKIKFDSVALYYKDISYPNYNYISIKDSLLKYEFKIKPPKDGSIIQYYYKAFIGKNIYGYEQKSFYSFVKADSTVITKLEISPNTGDTIILPSEYEVTFNVKGYYGSQFTPITRLDSLAFSWELINASGCNLSASKGTRVVLRTGSQASSDIVKLKLKVDTTKVSLNSKWIQSPEIFVFIKVTGKKISSLAIKRTDALNPLPITTSSVAKAEFVALGIDEDKNEYTITPQWKIWPLEAGSFSSDGVFRPSQKFSGRVRIFAQSGSLSGEFNPKEQFGESYGLEVQHVVTCKSKPDTVTNYAGITIIFPDSAVLSDNSALIKITEVTAKNQAMRVSGKNTVIGSIFDIMELNNVLFNLQNNDSIMIVLNIPQEISESKKISIGYWNDDSLKWDVLSNSKISLDKKFVSANIVHFSKYAVLMESQSLQSSFNVIPNPFSPLRSPSEFPKLASIFGPMAPKGTCISFIPDVPEQKLKKIKIRIYTIQGDLVCSVVNQNAPKMVEYKLWWNGRTTNGDVLWDALPMGNDPNTRIFPQSGGKMCNNGRYFVMLTIEDSNGKEKSYLKHVVLVR